MDMQQINRLVVEQFRGGGPIDGMNRDRLVLLTTTGRTSGQLRTTPLMIERDGDDLLVIASNLGAPTHPDWYLNLVEQPRVTVELGNDRFDAHAASLRGERRDRVWTTLKERNPFFAEHEAKTSRIIPVVALTHIDGAG